MKWIKCPWNPRLRCYEHNERTCPFNMGAWILAVEEWALSGRTPRSLDPGAILGSLDIGSSERQAVRSANINQLFHDPEAVLDWLQAGIARMPMSVCQDLKQAGRKWRMAREWEKSTKESGETCPTDTRDGIATLQIGGVREA